MVPYRQPLNALDLITWFLKHESFSDYDLPSFDLSQTKLPSPVPRFGNEKIRGSLLWLGLALLTSGKRKGTTTICTERLPSDEAGIDEMTGLR